MNTTTESTMSNTQEQPSSQQNRAATVGRASKIRDAVKGAKLSPNEQECVAENMWRILADAEQRGIAKTTVLHEGGAGNEGDSTKRLERFALNPDLEPSRKQPKTARLTKGAQRYLRIAEAAGRLAFNNADAYVADLFNRTRYATAGDVAVAEDIYVELADLIRTICFGVARKHDLKRTFRLCDERQLSYYGRHLRRNPDDRWSDVWQGFADGTRVQGLLSDDYASEPYLWSLPYPSLLVGWTDLKCELPFRIVAESSVASSSEATDHSMLTKGELKLEVRLALLPIGPGGEPEPVFITCPWVFVRIGYMRKQYNKTGVPNTSWESNTKIPGLGWNLARPTTPRPIIEGQYLCEPTFESDAWTEAFRGFEGLEPERRYYDPYAADSRVRVDLISPESCRRYLSLSGSSSAVTDYQCCVVVDDLDPKLFSSELLGSEEWHEHWRSLKDSGQDPPESLHWRTSEGSLGEVIENSLFYAKNLDLVFDRICERYVEEIDSTLALPDRWRESEKAKLYAKWGDVGPAGRVSE